MGNDVNVNVASGSVHTERKRRKKPKRNQREKKTTNVKDNFASAFAGANRPVEVTFRKDSVDTNLTVNVLHCILTFTFFTALHQRRLCPGCYIFNKTWKKSINNN